MYIADFGNSRIRKVNTSGIISSLTPTVSVAGVAVDGAGNVYYTASFEVFELSPGGVPKVVAGGGVNIPGDGGPATSAGLGTVADVDIDTLGNIFLADTNESRVRKVTAPPACTFVLGATTLQPPAAGGEYSDQHSNLSRMCLVGDRVATVDYCLRSVIRDGIGRCHVAGGSDHGGPRHSPFDWRRGGICQSIRASGMHVRVEFGRAGFHGGGGKWNRYDYGAGGL